MSSPQESAEAANPPPAASNPCKLILSNAPELTFQINASDMPVSCSLSDLTLGVKLIDVDVMDNNDQTPNKGPTGHQFPNLPDSSFTLQLAPGDYTVFLFISPAMGASASLPLGGKTLNLLEKCATQTILSIFSDETPQPHFRVVVK